MCALNAVDVQVGALLHCVLSPTSSTECLDSLLHLLRLIRQEELRSSIVDAITRNRRALHALCHLISRSTLPSTSYSIQGELIEQPPEVEIEDADVAAGQLLSEVLSSRTPSISKTLLHYHYHQDDMDREVFEYSALVPSLLDCLCPTRSAYVQVLSLKILQGLLETSRRRFHKQLKKALIGIHQLVDLLGSGTTTTAFTSLVHRVTSYLLGNESYSIIPEEVRRQAVLFLTHLASSSANFARLTAFSNGFNRSLKIAFEKVKLAENSTTAKDCLKMCLALAQVDVDAREFCLGGKHGKETLDYLAKLMNWIVIRKMGVSYASMESDVSSSKCSGSIIVSMGPLLPDDTGIIDLICDLLLVLLYDGDYKSQMPRPPQSSSDASLAKRRARAKTIASHALLTRSLVSCALCSLPHPGEVFVGAVPFPELQQKALMTLAVLASMGDTIAKAWNGSGVRSPVKESAESKTDEEETSLVEYMSLLYLDGRVTAMEQLMHLACTGAYRPRTGDHDILDESAEATASLISANAISVFRSCISPEAGYRTVLRGMAAPGPHDTDEFRVPLDMPVVKLVNTLVENLRFLQSKQHCYQGKQGQHDVSSETDGTTIYSATISASGAAAALGVLLTKGGYAMREFLLRMPLPSPPKTRPDNVACASSESIASKNLINFILQFVSSYNHSEDLSSISDVQSLSGVFQHSVVYVAVSLLQLLAKWIEGMPEAVREVMISPSSISLKVFVRYGSQNVVAAMSGLLLGLCLKYNVNKGSNLQLSKPILDVENSSCTNDTLMEVILSMGVERYYETLDEWKEKALPLPYCTEDTVPVLEKREISTWYSRSVARVRRFIKTLLCGCPIQRSLDTTATIIPRRGHQLQKEKLRTRSNSFRTSTILYSLSTKNAGEECGALSQIIERVTDMFRSPEKYKDYRNSKVFANDLLRLNKEVWGILEKESRCVFLQNPVYVFGDIHGNLQELRFFSDKIWSLGMARTAGKFVFLGDYVDRGESSLECVAYLLAMKLSLPQKVFLLRGNHETRKVNGCEHHYRERSFRYQCCDRFGRKMGSKVWRKSNQTFDRMPLSAVIDHDVFCVHGGPPRPISDINEGGSRIKDILKVPTVTRIDCPKKHKHDRYQKVASDCIWIDPASEMEEWRTVDEESGYGKSLRRKGAICFGQKAVADFLKQEGFSYIIRAHEAHAEGVSLSKDARVLTVFSTSKDHNQGNNAMAGCVFVDGEKILVIKVAPDAANIEDGNNEDTRQPLDVLEAEPALDTSSLEVGRRVEVGQLLAELQAERENTTRVVRQWADRSNLLVEEKELLLKQKELLLEEKEQLKSEAERWKSHCEHLNSKLKLNDDELEQKDSQISSLRSQLAYSGNELKKSAEDRKQLESCCEKLKSQVAASDHALRVKETDFESIRSDFNSVEISNIQQENEIFSLRLRTCQTLQMR